MQNKTTSKAWVQPETLTDNSIVYNVVQNGEAIAHPASREEAEAICETINNSLGQTVSFREEDCGGVLGCDGNVYSDADPGL